MSKDPNILLQHILESVEALQEYLVGVDQAEYLSNMEKQDSAERRLQVVGEAIVQLPHEFKDKHPDIPWAKIAGLRNRLVHEYFDIDHKLVWNTIEKSLPVFKQQIEALLEK
ncbi:MAG: DUF86 domain-containing protein [Candidatus Yanofskybacteria bacterium]|nr:DUF86 domain-containing protein [Candidatus Yanofskybacteria bacterium]